MKLEVFRDFKDKHTGELYKAGAVLDVTDERGAEILNNDLHLADRVDETVEDAPKPKRARKRAID